MRNIIQYVLFPFYVITILVLLLFMMFGKLCEKISDRVYDFYWDIV